MISIDIKKGSELNLEDLETINFWRKKEFNSTTIWNKKNYKAFYDDEIFLLKEDSRLVAFGRLKSVPVYIEDSRYNIWGISGIVAIKKNLGYGKRITNEISNYIQKNPKTAIGFCIPINTKFYEKLGYKIIKGGQKYFIYIDEKEKEHSGQSDVIYIEGNDNLVNKLLTNNNLIIKHYVPHW